MSLDELRNIQIDDILRWPLKTKIIAVAIIVAIMGVIAWFELISPINTQYNLAAQNIKSLKQQVRDKQMLAAALPAYQDQIKVMNNRFHKFLEQLPNRSQIPSLLDDVTSAGSTNGLAFNLFKPSAEVQKNFYVEIPVQLKVIGTYNDMGKFAQAVAAMPRIVTMDSVHISRVPENNLTPAEKAASHQMLEMQCNVTTYRYKVTRAAKGAKKNA